MLARCAMQGVAVVLFTAALSTTAPALDISNAEVIVTSSSNTAYVGMTNTDTQGRFVLNGVPAGGLSVIIRRNGVVIAQGAGVAAGGNLSEAQAINITVTPMIENMKSSPPQ